MKNNRPPIASTVVESIAAFLWTCLIMAVFLAAIFSMTGCNSEQIAMYENEQVRLVAEAERTAIEIIALSEAIAHAKVLGNEEVAKVLAASKVLEEKHAQKIKRQRDQNAVLLEASRDPNVAMQDGVEAFAPMLPPPFNYLIPVLTAALFGETARRRGNRKVQKVGEVLEMAGAVRFGDSQKGRAASERMGSPINAHLTIGRDKAKARIAEVTAARGE